MSRVLLRRHTSPPSNYSTCTGVYCTVLLLSTVIGAFKQEAKQQRNPPPLVLVLVL